MAKTIQGKEHSIQKGTVTVATSPNIQKLDVEASCNEFLFQTMLPEIVSSSWLLWVLEIGEHHSTVELFGTGGYD